MGRSFRDSRSRFSPELSTYLLRLSITFFKKIAEIIIEFPDVAGYFGHAIRARLQ
jgi:hypothetical protein